MPLLRRDTFPLVATLLASRSVTAKAETTPETIPLWRGLPPGGGSGPAAAEQLGRHGQVTSIRVPRLLMHRPLRPDGTAVIVVGGGGYHSIALGRESAPTARWLAMRGVTAFELVYRLPHEGWPRDATFADGRRAVQVVRAQADRLGVNPNRIGVVGFSSGAHLAGMIAVGASLGRFAPIDATDRLVARPDFAGLIYPVLTMMPPWNQTKAFRQLLGDDPTAADCSVYSVDRQVKADGPTVFLAQAADDPIPPVENSILMLSSLRRAGLLPELHIFQHGGHGWGLGAPGSEVSAWPSLYSRWLCQNSS